MPDKQQQFLAGRIGMYRITIGRVCRSLLAMFVLFPLSAGADDFMSPGITADELQAELGSPQAKLVVDLRKPVEFAVGHIPGAVNIPLDELAARLDELRHDNGVLVYCINGARTRQAEPLLYNNDITNVFHLEGAFQAWLRGNHPVEKGGVKKTGW
jgi:rhodanese-related sulfurtransferase